MDLGIIFRSAADLFIRVFDIEFPVFGIYVTGWDFIVFSVVLGITIYIIRRLF